MFVKLSAFEYFEACGPYLGSGQEIRILLMCYYVEEENFYFSIFHSFAAVWTIAMTTVWELRFLGHLKFIVLGLVILVFHLTSNNVGFFSVTWTVRELRFPGQLKVIILESVILVFHLRYNTVGIFPINLSVRKFSRPFQSPFRQHHFAFRF